MTRLLYATFLLISCVQKLNYLFWDGGIVPVLCQVNFGNQAVVIRNVSQKDNTESNYSIRHVADTEQKKNDLLETSPLTQKSCGVIIILHRLRIQVSLIPGKGLV